MRLFPLVPTNVPMRSAYLEPGGVKPLRPPGVDELDRYLSLYNAEAEGLLASYGAGVHPEWDINVRAPVMWNGGGLSGAEGLGRRIVSHMQATRPLYGVETRNVHLSGVETRNVKLSGFRLRSSLDDVGQPMGVDPTSFVNQQAGTTLVSAMWAQRAANAWAATYAGGVFPPIQVDGIVGPATLGLLRAAQFHWWAAQTSTPIPADTGQTNTSGIPMPVVSGSGVAIANEFVTYLQGLTQVADPPATPRSSPSPSPSPVPLPVFPALPVLPAAAGAGAGTVAALAALALGAWYLSRR